MFFQNICLLFNDNFNLMVNTESKIIIFDFFILKGGNEGLENKYGKNHCIKSTILNTIRTVNFSYFNEFSPARTCHGVKLFMTVDLRPRAHLHKGATNYGAPGFNWPNMAILGNPDYSIISVRGVRHSTVRKMAMMIWCGRCNVLNGIPLAVR